MEEFFVVVGVLASTITITLVAYWLIHLVGIIVDTKKEQVRMSRQLITLSSAVENQPTVTRYVIKDFCSRLYKLEQLVNPPNIKVDKPKK